MVCIQCSHLYGLSPECIRRCWRVTLAPVNSFSSATPFFIAVLSHNMVLQIFQATKLLLAPALIGPRNSSRALTASVYVCLSKHISSHSQIIHIASRSQRYSLQAPPSPRVLQKREMYCQVVLGVEKDH